MSLTMSSLRQLGGSLIAWWLGRQPWALAGAQRYRRFNKNGAPFAPARLWVTGGAIGVVLLAACMPATDGAARSPRAAPSVKVTFLVAGSPAEIAGFQSVVEGFQATKPRVNGAAVTVELASAPTATDFLTRLTAELAAGAPPDVFLLNYRRLTQFYNHAALEPLATRLAASKTLHEADFYPIALDGFRDSKGALVCLPQSFSSQVVYYNKDLFDELGVAYPPADWTWAEFRRWARQLTLPDKNDDSYPDRYGLGLEPVLIRMAPFIWQNGGELVDQPAQPTRLTLDAPATREALAFILNLGRKDGVVPNYNAEAVSSHLARFLAGNIAMYVDSRFFVPTLRGAVKFRWDVAPLPRGKTAANVLYSDGYCLAAQSKVKDAAWAFIEYALGPEGQTRANHPGRTVPSLRSVAESAVFLEPTQPPANAKVWLDNVSIMRVLPKLENWAAIERTAGTGLEQAYLGHESMEGVITAVQAIASEGFAPIR